MKELHGPSSPWLSSCYTSWLADSSPTHPCQEQPDMFKDPNFSSTLLVKIQWSISRCQHITFTQLSLSDRVLGCLVDQLGPSSELEEPLFHVNILNALTFSAQLSLPGSKQMPGDLSQAQYTSLCLKLSGTFTFSVFLLHLPEYSLLPQFKPCNLEKHYEASVLAFLKKCSTLSSSQNLLRSQKFKTSTVQMAQTLCIIIQVHHQQQKNYFT